MMYDMNVLIGLIDYKPLVVLDESILKGSTLMNKSNLLAPEKYNIVSEIEKYASEDHKKPLFTRITSMKIFL